MNGTYSSRLEGGLTLLLKKHLLHIKVIFTVVILHTTQNFAQVEVTNFGDIPTQNIAASRWENFQWNDPGGWKTINVADEGIDPNSNADIGSKLENLINNGNGRRIFKFPAGTFKIRSNVHITKNDVQIVGEGKATKFLLDGGTNDPSIIIRGSRSSSYSMTSNAPRGSDQIKINSTSGISVGTYIILTQPGDGPRNDPETQIVMVTNKNGNTLTVDTKIGITFYSSKTTIQRYGSAQNVRLSDFYIKRNSTPTINDNNKRSFNIDLINARNVEIANIESDRAYSSHITMSRCTEVIVRDSYIHGNFGGGGGTQGGITMNFCSKIYVINNKTSDLRHHIMTQFGSDHCVIAYNRAEAPYNSYQDIGQHNSKGCHNNLFEGNYGRQIFDDNNTKKGWGTRYTTWYRNHATDIIGADHGDANNNNIIANEFTSGSQGAAIAKGPNNIVGANIFGINKEAGNGNLIWKDINANANLPSSLFLNNQPSYVDRWPIYGPGVGDSTSGTASPTYEDKITNTNPPLSVEQGETVSIDVSYEASTTREIVVMFQLDTNPWTEFKVSRTVVSKGNGTKNIEIEIPVDVNVANDLYQFQVFLTNPGGVWTDRLANKVTKNVSVTALQLPSGPVGFTYANEEGTTVNVSGTVDIAYGAEGQFVILENVTVDTPCNNTTFGDPIPGIKKACYVKNISTVDGGTIASTTNETSITTTTGDGIADIVTFKNTSTAEATYLYLITDENGNILTTETSDHNFEGASVGICKVYGISYQGNISVEGKNIKDSGLATGAFEVSSNTIIIDRQAENTLPPSDIPDGYAFAAKENETVQVNGTVNVAYGAENKFVILENVTIDTPCNNVTFGDPIPGVRKSCYVQQVSDSSTTVASNNCAFGAPTANSLASIDRGNYTNIFVLGNGPDLSNIRRFRINWDKGSNNLIQFAFNTANGQPSYYIDLRNKIQQNFANSQPSIKITNSNIGVDGDYWVTKRGNDFVMASKDGNYSLYFSTSSSTPNCSSKNALKQLDNNTITLFPNPAKASFNIDLGSITTASIEIFNMLGQKVYEATSKNKQLHTVSETPGLISGMYLIKIITIDGLVNTKSILIEY